MFPCYVWDEHQKKPELSPPVLFLSSDGGGGVSHVCGVYKRKEPEGGKNETVARSRSRKLLCGFEPYINAKQNYTAKCSRP